MTIQEAYTLYDINEEPLHHPDAVLIDCREEDEYQQGHLPNALNIPLSQFQLFPMFQIPKEQELLIYCHSGNRAGQAILFLDDLGYTKLKNLGGTIHYRGELVQE